MQSSDATGDVDLPSEQGFAPRDLTDGRLPGDWHSRYGSKAWAWIAAEAVYLIVLLAAFVYSAVLVWLRYPATWWRLTPLESAIFTRYAYAWLGGTLGGVLFAMKWLYHSVGKAMWNIDRAPWRYLTPHISGGLGFVTVAILNSIIATEQSAAMSGAKAIAIGFLVGFFSDNTLAKLNEVAETLLGPTGRFKSSRHRRHDDQNTN